MDIFEASRVPESYCAVNCEKKLTGLEKRHEVSVILKRPWNKSISPSKKKEALQN